MKTKPAASALLVLACFVATPVEAAEFVRKSGVNGGPDIVTITGKILQNDEAKFYDIAYGLKDVSIVVNSNGGWLQAAARIGVYVRHKNWETRLLSGSVCNSACTLIFLAGTSRYMDSKTKLGFHSAGMAAQPRQRNEASNKNIATYLAWVQAPQQIIDLQPKADPCCLNYVNYAQAKAWGVLSDRSAKQQQALPTPPASSKAVTIWPVRPTLPEPMPQQTLIPETQQPAGPPATPHANTPPVRGTESTLCAKRNDAECVAVIHKRMEPGSQQPELVPQQTLSIPETQQPAATPKNVEDWIEPARPQGAIIRDTQQSPDVRQKVVLYEEDPADPNGKRYVGSAIWRTEMVTPSAGQPQELAIRADIEVPERKIMVRWALRRNTDKGLPATHTVEIMFKVPADFPAGGITNVPGILMKQAEQTRGIPLAGLTVKVTPGFYLIGLSNLDPDKERNFQLLDERGWFDIPVVYNNNRRAILSMEKGTTGESVFAEAFKAWKQ